MKKSIYSFFATLAISALIFGCAGTLNPDGVYKGDKFLYNTDKVIVDSFVVVNSFLIWEMENNDYVKSNWPAIFKDANDIREKAPAIITSVNLARTAYVTFKSGTNTSAEQFQIISNSLVLALGKFQATAAPLSAEASKVSTEYNKVLEQVKAKTSINTVTNLQ